MASAARLGANQSTRRRAWRARSCVFYFARRDRGIQFFQISLVHHCVRGGGGGTERSMFNGECGIIRTSSEQRLRTVYLVRGAGWSPWFVEPHTRDRPKKPDEPDPRHAPRNGSTVSASQFSLRLFGGSGQGRPQLRASMILPS